jgi:hypothetical protein
MVPDIREFRNRGFWSEAAADERTGRALEWEGLLMRARRLGLGLATILGVARWGFFIPYRHAASVEPAGYPALAPIFEAAEPAFLSVLDAIEGLAPEIGAIGRDGGRARFDQMWFPRLDAAAAYAIVRRNAPARIVEVGSGHSTRFLAPRCQ